MSLSSSNTDKKGMDKFQLISKTVQEQRSTADAYPCSKSLTITDLPDDCLRHVHKRLEARTDYSSFGLVCRRWLHIQNNNHESLWNLAKYSLRNSPKINPQRFSLILCKLLIRFQHLKSLCLGGLPEVTDYAISQIQLFGSEVRFLWLKDLIKYSDKKLCLIFSSLPHLEVVCLSGTRITDKGLEVLAKCCASLERVDLGNCQQITDEGLKVLSKCCVSLGKVDLTNCQRITDSGISFLIQNCSKLHSTVISHCNNITGIGFLGCQKTLTGVWALGVPKLTTEGIKSTVSGGGIQSLGVSGNATNNKAIINVSKSCHEEVELEGWKAIGLYCRNLEKLYVYDCPTICDQGLEALCYGCNNLSYIDATDVRWRFYAREYLKRE